MAISKRIVTLLLASVLALGACGGDDGNTTTTVGSGASSEGVATTEAPGTSQPEVDATTTTTTIAIEPSSGTGPIEVVFDDGRNWTFEGFCTYTPDASGPASALWNIEAQDLPDGASFGAIMVFPFDPAKTTPVLIGTMVDGEDNPYVFIEVEDLSDGSNLILDFGVHDGVFKSLDDPADFHVLVTCEL